MNSAAINIEAAAQTALTSAMSKAGIFDDIKIDCYTDRTDCYADYTGWRVQASTEDLRQRAAAWARAWLTSGGVKLDAAFTDGDLRRSIPGRGYEYIPGRGSRIPEEVYARFIRTGRYSIGD